MKELTGFYVTSFSKASKAPRKIHHLKKGRGKWFLFIDYR